MHIGWTDNSRRGLGRKLRSVVFLSSRRMCYANAPRGSATERKKQSFYQETHENLLKLILNCIMNSCRKSLKNTSPVSYHNIKTNVTGISKRIQLGHRSISLSD
jgi:hypothetical protein